jgi:2,4-dienoyl-CoA reductase-like NADH-dependent reductase (Old Yellow Enzyme family)/thioredoxin reductase
MLKNLFSPMKIGNLEIANRLVVSAMVTLYCNDDGTVTEKYIAYHEAKAKGGWGLIITEDYAIDPQGRGFPKLAGLWEDAQIESHAELTRRVHQYNSKIFAQIYHAGRQTNPRVIGGQPWAPSPIPSPATRTIPHEMTTDEIREMVEKFGDCALRIKKAGFDGIEIHGAHGYLIAQFLSSYSNKRTDQYGGNLPNRVRFALEVIANIREKAGRDYPVSFKISADEFIPGGRTIEETKAIAVLLQEAGIDAILVSAGVYGSNPAITPSAATPQGWLVDFAEEVKKVVTIPVMTVGRITEPLMAETIIAGRKADFVAMARASLADPDLPIKAEIHNFDDIVRCIGCMQGCTGLLGRYQPIKCSLNPSLGREHELSVPTKAVKKKVVVAGGGPAGMEAAITAAKADYRVLLFEKAGRLGGQFYLAAIPPDKGEFSSFVTWQISQLNKLGVKVHLNTEATEELIDGEQPDAVILSTGSAPIVPQIKGIEKGHVLTAAAVLNGEKEIGRTAVIIGGGMVGAETAYHLASLGRTVTIVEQLDKIAPDVEAIPREILLNGLKKERVNIYVNTTVQEILDNGILVSTDGRGENIPANTVILAVGSIPENKLTRQLEGKPYPVMTIGDALQVRRVLEAVEEGFDAGRKI